MICVFAILVGLTRRDRGSGVGIGSVRSRTHRKSVEQQMARVNVNEFRTACVAKGEPVSGALGRLVTAELRRRSTTRRRSTPATTLTLFDEEEA